MKGRSGVRLLLCAFPSGIRRDYAEEMADLFERQLSEAATARVRVGVWRRGLRDMGSALITESR